MKKLILLLVVLPILTACQTGQLASGVSHQKTPASSEFVRLLTDDLLNFSAGMIQGDSPKPLSAAFKACVKQPYPELQATVQQLIKQEFSQDEIALLNETFVYIKNDKSSSDPIMQAKIREAQALMKSQKMQKVIAILFHETEDSRQITSEIYNHINARLSACMR